MERGRRPLEVAAGVETKVPFENFLLIGFCTARLDEIRPPIVPIGGHPLGVARAVFASPGLINPTVNFRCPPGGIDKTDWDIKCRVKLRAHPIECRAVLPDGLVRRSFPLDINGILARIG